MADSPAATCAALSAHALAFAPAALAGKPSSSRRATMSGITVGAEEAADAGEDLLQRGAVEDAPARAEPQALGSKRHKLDEHGRRKITRMDHARASCRRVMTLCARPYLLLVAPVEQPVQPLKLLVAEAHLRAPLVVQRDLQVVALGRCARHVLPGRGRVCREVLVFI